MKLALIAVSGIRAENPELTELGLSLPGFLERARTLFAMPSLSLLTLAGMTPSDCEIEYREYREFPAEDPPLCDLAAITSFTAQIEDAYRIADIYRRRGTSVVMGGLHVSSLPEEAAAHADAVAVGEGELLWPEILNDFQSSRLRPRYDQPRALNLDFSESPLPRYDLLEPEKYNRFPVQTSRGCPFKCEFCASSIMLTPRYTHKPVERVMAEIREIKRRWPRPFIEFADDNTFADHRYGRELVEAVAKENVKWFAETDISIAQDDELLRLIAQSGCRQILVGLETPTEEGLNGLELRSNWKYRKRDFYRAAIERIQSHGITLNGCFVLGLDGDTEEVFDLIPQFVEETALYDVQVTVQTAFPGTPLYRRLAAQGRLLEPRNWRKCSLFDVNFRPLRMTPERLEERFRELVAGLYSNEALARRHRRFFEVYGERFRGIHVPALVPN
ncbi:MAG: radical SAM protein [Terriglobia bacterium]